MVKHCLITVMADAGDHREREVGYIERQFVAVKRREVGCGTTTTYDYHHIEEILIHADPF